MKKMIFAGVLFAALGTTGVCANNFNTSANAKPETEMSVKSFYYVTTYSTRKEGSCNVKYKHVTKYFLGFAIYTTTTLVSKDCSGDGGGNTGGNTGGTPYRF
ncbi:MULTISPECIES: hypothetical protein [Chryseobacterium]|uniref:hypothetical protein n=1 Tax=Chryseobacterium TaxID=59732 RepID=UPI0012970462|nr:MULTISPECIES: hypothetical protein [Chryseobacterium]MDR6919697.1 hypothetical protein [Chryseobacterium sp. 2987]